MGFTEIREGAGKKIALSVVLLGVAVAITIYYNTGGGSSGSRSRVLKCNKCGHVMEVSPEQFKQMRNEHNEKYLDEMAKEDPESAEKLRKMLESPEGMMRGPDMMRPGMMMPSWGYNEPMTCPECGEEDFWLAIKCQKCGEVFFRGQTGGDFADECPKCGYSKIRERKEARAAEKKKKLEDRKKKREKGKK